MTHREYHPSNVPVVVTTFAFTVGGQPERVYAIVKLRDEDLFLTRTMRMLAKNAWSKKLKRAALFDTPQKARQFVERVFSDVTLDL